MAGLSLTRAIAAFVLCLVAAGSTGARAQTYEGAGLLKVGVFLQDTLADVKLNKVDSGGSPLTSGSSSLNSVGGGISAGFDYRIRNFLIGVEGDGALANGDGRVAGEKFNNDYFLTVRGRLGAFVRENLIIYGTAGWAGMGMSWRRSDAVVSTSALTVSAIMSGWTVGGGVEYDLPGYVLFAEYLHSDFGSWSFNDFSGNRLTVDANSDVFRIGAKFKVGFDHYPM